jgi:AcrR family transcriptional regulator
VLQAAIDLVDREGIEALTMRKLAERLAVEAMSLYHHVPGKVALLDGMVDLVFSEIALPEPDEGWKQAMRRRAISFRQVLSHRHWAITLMQSRKNPAPATLKHHEAVLHCLREAGFSIELAAHAFSLLDSYIFGFVLSEITLPFDNPEELSDVAKDILVQLPADEYPYLAEMTSCHVLQPGYDFANEYEFGLDLILDSLERLWVVSPKVG